MGVHNYQGLKSHVGHLVEVVAYGDPAEPANVAVQCITCGCVLLDYDLPEDIGYQVMVDDTEYPFDGHYQGLPYIPSWAVFTKEDAERLARLVEDAGWKNTSLVLLTSDDVEDAEVISADIYLSGCESNESTP